MATKSATVLARMEPELKQEAEAIMDQLGLPVSVVINCLYKQIVFKRRIPFSLDLPDAPKSRDAMTDEEFNEMMSIGLAEAKAGKGLPVDEAFAAIRQEL